MLSSIKRNNFMVYTFRACGFGWLAACSNAFHFIPSPFRNYVTMRYFLLSPLLIHKSWSRYKTGRNSKNSLYCREPINVKGCHKEQCFFMNVHTILAQNEISMQHTLHESFKMNYKKMRKEDSFDL